MGFLFAPDDLTVAQANSQLITKQSARVTGTYCGGLEDYKPATSKVVMQLRMTKMLSHKQPL